MITSFDRLKRRKSFCHRFLRHSERYRTIWMKTAFQSAVNRQVAGSNPARGANSKIPEMKCRAAPEIGNEGAQAVDFNRRLVVVRDHTWYIVAS
jgi:hypothetical protein